MGNTTDQLLKQLSNINSISKLQEFTSSTEEAAYKISFHEYLAELLRTSELSISEVIHNSGIQRNYAYQILNGTKKPGRNKVISLCLALTLPLNEVQRALTIAEEGILYPKNKRDSIIIFSINKHYSVQETNDLLYEFNEDLL